MEPLKKKILDWLKVNPTPSSLRTVATHFGTMIEAYEVVHELEECGACSIRNEIVYPNQPVILQLLSHRGSTRDVVENLPTKPIQKREAVILKKIGETYRDHLRRLGKRLNDKLGSGKRVEVGSRAFAAGLDNPQAAWDVANLVGGYVAWLARNSSPEFQENGYTTAWEMFSRLMPSIAHDALGLIIPYSAGTQFSELVATSELPVFAAVWVCVIEERKLTRSSFNESIHQVTETLAMERAVPWLADQELQTLHSAVRELIGHDEFLNIVRYMLWEIDPKIHQIGVNHE